MAAMAAMEGTVLRVPCVPSERRRGFRRSSVRSLGPPGPNLGSGRRLRTAARRTHSAECARSETPASPRQRRAARCAPECAHALEAVPPPVPACSIRGRFAVRRRRAGTASRSVHPVDVIETNQTSEARDE
jgi:hypothetical protein